jgi:hypothetical protein
VHSKSDCDVRRLAKRSMLSSIMAFTEVINTIAREGMSQLHIGCERVVLTSNELQHASKLVGHKTRPKYDDWLHGKFAPVYVLLVVPWGDKTAATEPR